MCTMLLIPLIPIVALVTQNMIILNNIIVRKADLKVRLYVSLLFQFIKLIILLICKLGLNVFLLSLVYRQCKFLLIIKVKICIHRCPENCLIM